MAAGIPLPSVLGGVLASVRAAAWLVVTPPFSNPGIPMTARIGLAAGLGMIGGRTLAHSGALPLTTAGFVVALVAQVVTGFALGAVMLTLISIIEAAGNLAGLFGGFSLPPSIDPLSLDQSPPVGVLYELIAITLLFTTGGDLLLVRGFLVSFGAVGWTVPTAGPLASGLAHELAMFFQSALLLAAPLIGVLFVAQIVLAVLSKALPQMNVFAWSFPFQILLTVAGVVVAVTALPGELAVIVQRVLLDMHAQLVPGG